MLLSLDRAQNASCRSGLQPASWLPNRDSPHQEAIERICVNEDTINPKGVVGEKTNLCALNVRSPGEWQFTALESEI